MKKRTLLILLLICCYTITFAQRQIKGKIIDQKGAPISAANVSLKDREGNIISYTRTNTTGSYSLNLVEDAKDLSIETTIIGYEKKSTLLTDFNKSYNFTLTESETVLQPVVVKNKPMLYSKGDTLNYKTSDFADFGDRSIGDVLRKMPGIEVTEEGKVYANGKAISALYIDGDNILDDKYSIGTKSIPHLAVDKVQVIEKDQPIKMLRKNNMSDDVAINLVLKDEAKMKVMGEIKAGLGTPNRFDVNINAMMFNNKLKFINNLKGSNIGVDLGADLASFNLGDYSKRIDNDRPDKLLSAGAAGVPTLPQRRTLFNKAGLSNLNNMYKFNDDLQVKANIAYLYDKRYQQYNKFSETYLQGETIAYREMQDNHVNPQQLQTKFNVLNNAENHYLNNTLTLDYNTRKTNSSVIINGIGAFQSLSQKTFDIANELIYRKKLKSENTFNIYSFFNKTTQPEILGIQPGLNEQILNNGDPYAGLNQYIKLPTIYTNNNLSFGFNKSKFFHTYKVGFNVQQQNLNSELYSVQNDLTTSLVSENMTNNLEWLKSKIYGEATFEYKSDKFKANLTLPASHQYINYSDEGKDLNTDLNRFFVNPSIGLRYQTGIENYIQANYSYNNSLGGIDDVYSGTILKNYRSLFTNNAPISERQSQNVSATFNLKKAMKMFFFNTTASYTNTALNTISSYTLTNNIQQRIVLPLANDIKSFSLSANTSKYLFSLKSTISLGVNYTNSNFHQLQNNELLPFTANSTSFKAGVDAKITDYINWSYNGTYTTAKNRTTALNAIQNNNQQLRQQSSISATALKKLLIKVSPEHILTQQSAQPDLKYLFADINLRYKIFKYKTDLEFNLTNIANVKKFEANYLSANSFTSGIYEIPGRVAMLKATFNF